VALDPAVLSSWGQIGRLSGNDFESVLFGRHPELRRAFEALAATHPLVCRMSGSGSALFAVYRSAADRDQARMVLGRKYGDTMAVETLASQPPGPVEAGGSGIGGGEPGTVNPEHGQPAER
jgi:4-diphosphocytidyl-2C-methyl-D-erythritol kinase